MRKEVCVEISITKLRGKVGERGGDLQLLPKLTTTVDAWVSEVAGGEGGEGGREGGGRGPAAGLSPRMSTTVEAWGREVAGGEGGEGARGGGGMGPAAWPGASAEPG